MSMKINEWAAWFGILLSYCAVGGVALVTHSGEQRPVLVGALALGFIALNGIGAVLTFRKKSDPARSRGRAGFGYGLMVGAVVAAVIWLLGP